MESFKSDINYDAVKSMDFEGLKAYALDNFVSDAIKSRPDYYYNRRAKILSIVCNMLKIKPNNEQWVFLLADCERLLCEAGAGAGKTTMSMLKIVDAKLTYNIPGRDILALAYNTHAAADMKERHASIISMINRCNVKELQRDTNLSCHTFHAFCKSWVQEYPSMFNIQNINGYLLKENQQCELMRLSVTTYQKANKKNFFFTDSNITDLISLYSFAKETLTISNPENWKLSTAYSSLEKSEFSIESIQGILQMYDRAKHIKGKLDFTDLVENMYTLCKDPNIMRRIRANYRVFLVDEFQDITPSMLQILRLIINGDESLGIPPYDDARLICIGDGDQSIYGFRGTDPDNCIRFKDLFATDTGMIKITTMSENRRCPSEVLDRARLVIESNNRRIEKPLHAVKDGGTVSVYEYTSQLNEMSQLISKLKGMPQDRLSSTCVCYRTLNSSYLLTLELIKNGIPFRIGSGNMPLTDKLSMTIFDCLNMLTYPDLLDHTRKALYKVVPKSATFKRETMLKLLDEEEERRKKGEERRKFYELPFPECANSINGFSDALAILKKAQSLHQLGKPMRSYMPYVIKLIRKYYLDWQLTNNVTLNDEYISYITEWFSRSMSYDEFEVERTKLNAGIADNSSQGVYVTTFHGLKGLEFRDVFIIDLADRIFPGTELNQAMTLSQSQKDILENEARRLFYVAITRSKENLSLYFSSDCPSRYIRFFKENVGLAKTYESYLQSEGEFLAADISVPSDGDNTDFDLGIDVDTPACDEPAPADLEAKTNAFDLGIDTDLAEQPKHVNLFAEASRNDSKLIEAIGKENFESIAAKPRVKSIVSRMFLNQTSGG